MDPNLTDARRRWLSELYEANSGAVFNLCRRLLTSREDAADATHEVFLRAVASLTEPPSSPQARAWLMTVARNHCIDLLRRRERFGSALTTLAASADAGGESIKTVEDRELLIAVLRQLGVRDREALWQSAVERRSLPEIAHSFGLSYMAAAKLLSRARQRAVVLAARLAVILGIAQLGRALRRSDVVLRGEQVAAVVVVPLVIAAVVVSSSPQPPIGASATSQAGAQSPAPSVAQRPAPVPGVLPGTGPSSAASPLEVGAVGQVLGVEVAVVQPVPSQSTNTPAPGHRRGHGKALGHGKTHGLGKALGHHK